MSIVRDQKSVAGASVETVIAWIVTALTFGYFLPWALAATRRKSNSWSIFALNFLLGWTLIGWIIALVMALSAHQVAIAPAPVVVNTLGYQQVPPTAIAASTTPALLAAPAVPAGWYPQGDGSQRYWDGAAWTEHVTPKPEQA